MAMIAGSVAAGTGLAQALYAQLSGQSWVSTAGGTTGALAQLCNALAAAIVPYIQANAAVSTTIQVGSLATAVTSGSGTSPVTGTATGTVA